MSSEKEVFSGCGLALRREDPGAEKKTIRVVWIEPGMIPVAKEIGADLKSLQEAVGGELLVYGPFSDSGCFLCRADAREKGLPVNRYLLTDRSRSLRVICGDILICSKPGADFDSLAEQQIEDYIRRFDADETFVKFNGRKVTILKPEKFGH